MKLSPRFPSRAIAWVRQSLHMLQEALRQWVPQPAQVLVPIPISAERRTVKPDGRHRARNG